MFFPAKTIQKPPDCVGAQTIAKPQAAFFPLSTFSLPPSVLRWMWIVKFRHKFLELFGSLVVRSYQLR